jgi:hypothetical protein
MAFRPSTQYECPFCKGIIPSADINASTDLALCRACGKTSSFSVISCQSELATVDLDHPPPRVRVGLTSDGRSKVVYRARSFVLLGFVLLWFAIVIGLVCGIQLYYSHFEPSITVIGAPGALALFLLGIYFAFARWEITAASGEGTVFLGVGSIGRRSRFHYSKNSLVTLVASSDDPRGAVAVATDDEVFVFGSGISDDALRFIAAWIRAAIARG